MVLEESWKHQNRHCLLDHTSFFVPKSFSESKDKDGKPDNEDKVAFRGLEGHCIDKVSMERD